MPIIDFNNECALCGDTYGIRSCVICGVRHCKDCREFVYEDQDGNKLCSHFCDDRDDPDYDEEWDRFIDDMFCYQFGD